MRLTMLILGWALALTAAALAIAGIAAAAPGRAEFGTSAIEQVLAQKWLLARGFQHLLLAGVAMTSGLAAMILARLLPEQ